MAVSVLACIFSLPACSRNSELAGFHSCTSQFLKLNQYLFCKFCGFCFSGEPWLIHNVSIPSTALVSRSLSFSVNLEGSWLWPRSLSLVPGSWELTCSAFVLTPWPQLLSLSVIPWWPHMTCPDSCLNVKNRIHSEFRKRKICSVFITSSTHCWGFLQVRMTFLCLLLVYTVYTEFEFLC